MRGRLFVHMPYNGNRGGNFNNKRNEQAAWWYDYSTAQYSAIQYSTSTSDRLYTAQSNRSESEAHSSASILSRQGRMPPCVAIAKNIGQRQPIRMACKMRPPSTTTKRRKKKNQKVKMALSFFHSKITAVYTIILLMSVLLSLPGTHYLHRDADNKGGNRNMNLHSTHPFVSSH